MSPDMLREAVQCAETIDGPMAGPPNRQRPWWRRRCRNWTRHPSHYCHKHRRNNVG